MNLNTSELDWHKAKPITFEFLRERYSYADMYFDGFSILGVMDGVLHLSNFQINNQVAAQFFVLFKAIHTISCPTEALQNLITHYEVSSLKGRSKRLTLYFPEKGELSIEYKDDLLYLCRLSDGSFTELQ